MARAMPIFGRRHAASRSVDKVVDKAHAMNPFRAMDRLNGFELSKTPRGHCPE